MKMLQVLIIPLALLGFATNLSAMNHYDLQARLNFGKQHDLRDAYGNNTLHNAALAGNQTEVKRLLNAYATDARYDNNSMWFIHGSSVPYVNLSGGFCNNTALHYAAREGHVRVVDMLLSYGAYVDIRNSAGDTPLHGAIRSGHMDVVETLIRHKADVTAKNWHDETAMSLATKNDDKELCGMLLQVINNKNEHDEKCQNIAKRLKGMR